MMCFLEEFSASFNDVPYGGFSLNDVHFRSFLNVLKCLKPVLNAWNRQCKL